MGAAGRDAPAGDVQGPAAIAVGDPHRAVPPQRTGPDGPGLLHLLGGPRDVSCVLNRRVVRDTRLGPGHLLERNVSGELHTSRSRRPAMGATTRPRVSRVSRISRVFC